MASIEKIQSSVLEQFNLNPNISWTVRQVYYRLVSNQIIPNTQTSYKQFDRQLTKLREQGKIPDYKFVDTARTIIEANDAQQTKEEYLDEFLDGLNFESEFFTTSRWERQDYNPIVVVEKEALSRLIAQVTKQYRIPLAVGRGYSSRTQILQIADRLNPDKDNIIFYLGDFDPSGLDIQRSLEERLENEVNDYFEIERIQLTHDTAQHLNLPPNPAKLSDTRYSTFAYQYGKDSWELDALKPEELQHYIEDAIMNYINWDEWKKSIQEEEKGKQELKEQFDKALDLLNNNL